MRSKSGRAHRRWRAVRGAAQAEPGRDGHPHMAAAKYGAARRRIASENVEPADYAGDRGAGRGTGKNSKRPPGQIQNTLRFTVRIVFMFFHAFFFLYPY